MTDRGFNDTTDVNFCWKPQNSVKSSTQTVWDIITKITTFHGTTMEFLLNVMTNIFCAFTEFNEGFAPFRKNSYIHSGIAKTRCLIV